MYLLSGEGEILATNPAAMRMLGHSGEALLGVHVSDLVTNAPDKLEAYLRRCAKSGALVPSTLQFRMQDGTVLDCQCGGALLAAGSDVGSRRILLRCKTKQEAVNRLMMLNRELDTLRTQYHQVRKERDRLDERVAERTASLARRTTELERVNRELDQFAYVTSHDLKAPLRAISNLSQWIEEDLGKEISEDVRAQMVLLRGRVARMEALIEGILQYSRVGRIAYEVKSVDVGGLLAAIVDSLSPPAGFTIEIAADMPVVVASEVALSQVFANLISNAIKYHDRPDGRVQIGWRDLGTSCIEFRVADDGPGIDPQYHEKIFMIFQTLQARDKVESTGVGLTVVKKIIEDQGGKITIESESGKGACFVFTWPWETKGPVNECTC